MYTNTPKPTPKHPLSWPELESGKNELPSGQPGPHLGKMFKKWTKLFKKWAKKKIHQGIQGMVVLLHCLVDDYQK